MPVPGTCRLCSRDSELQNSHILPEFVYEPMYDAAHRTFEMNATSGRTRPLQKGMREHLLCGECETQLSKYEIHFKKHWCESKGLPDPLPLEELLVLGGLDYKRFKLFHLSILWRAGVSSLEAFKNVQLGGLEPKIRKRLLDEDPGPPSLNCMLVTLLAHSDSRKLANDVILEPTMSRVNGHTVYTFVFAGAAWSYVASSHGAEDVVPLTAILGANGELVVLTKDLVEATDVLSMIGRHKAAGGKPPGGRRITISSQVE